MLGFIEWVNEEEKKKKIQGKKNVQSTHQGSPEIGAIDQQGKAYGSDQAISQQVVHYFPEP